MRDDSRDGLRPALSLRAILLSVTCIALGIGMVMASRRAYDYTLFLYSMTPAGMLFGLAVGLLARKPVVFAVLGLLLGGSLSSYFLAR